jgi:hypothetical protein
MLIYRRHKPVDQYFALFLSSRMKFVMGWRRDDVRTIKEIIFKEVVMLITARVCVCVFQP